MISMASLLSLVVSAVLSLIIGLEREYYAKSAGLRTIALVGVGATMFTLVAREGVWVVGPGTTPVDAARAAAQVITGIGFLGAGVIFVRRDAVRGLTTAATVWFAAAVGMACGAELWLLGTAATAMYLILTVALRPLESRVPHSKTAETALLITYWDGHGILRQILKTVADNGVQITSMDLLGSVQPENEPPCQRIRLGVIGQDTSVQTLTGDITELQGVVRIMTQSPDDPNPRLLGLD
jgi:putative Mg2+ transporter-C (MgtC) family protein